MPGFEEAERELFGHSQAPLQPEPPAGSLNRSQSALQLPSLPPADPWDHFQGDHHTPVMSCLIPAHIKSPGVFAHAAVTLLCCLRCF